MIRHMSLAALIAIALPTASLAGGKWSYGGRVGMNQSGNTVVPSAALSAEYTMNKYLSWRTDAELSFLNIAKMDTFALTIPTQLLLHPLGNTAIFDPYLGPSLSVSMGFDRKVAAGSQAVVGFSIHARKGQTFGLEGRWGWLDMVNGDPTWAMALTGNWNAKFGN